MLRDCFGITDDVDAGEVDKQPMSRGTCRVVMMTGFESFNVQLYKKARPCPLLRIRNLARAQNFLS